MILDPQSDRFDSCPMGRESAFTLIELLVALTLLSVIVVMFGTLYSQTDRIISVASGNRERSKTARTVLDHLSKELASARFPIAYHTTQNASATDLLTNPTRFSLYLRGDSSALATDGSISGNGLFWRAPIFDYTANRPTLASIGYFVRWMEEADGVRPVLGRLYVPAATNATNVTALEASTNWVNADVLDEYAPMIEPTHRGWFTDNVLALWIRPLDREGNAITEYPSFTSRGVLTSSPVATGGDFNSLRGYRTGTNYQTDFNGLPAMLEVALVVTDSRVWKGNTNRFVVDPALTTNVANYWNSIETYMDALPEKIRRHSRVYSTRIALPQAN